MVKRYVRMIAGIALGLVLMVACSGAQSESESQVSMHGPQVPPDGLAYDEWKQLPYAADTLFSVKRGWSLKTNRDASELTNMAYAKGADPAGGRVEFTQIQAELLGGEMKLRSGGYMEITVTVRFEISFVYSYKGGPRDDIVSGLSFSADDVQPFDRYTGTSFLNFSRYAGSENLNVGQATDTGFVESRITWNGRTYRILVKEDTRNTSLPFFNREERDGKTFVTVPGGTETIYTFRVPADYDGLAFCFARDDTGGGMYSTKDVDGKSAGYTDLYADILTNNDGTPLDPADCWFVRVSDLLRQAESAEAEESADP